ncbi:MAG: hypothetical protein ACJ8FT_10265 [Sphingomonas sp.]
MKKLYMVLMLASAAVTAPASAHPTSILYDSFGECNAALQQDNHFDRDFFGSFFPSNGAAEVNMINNWQCVYDPDLNAWHIEGQPFGGTNLGNGNGKANPGGQ